ncbi:hydantoinase/oxoprolinase N-terminal domain-containing protein [Pseudonocardia alaniniphila]|uniref:hydantoinase/oxoprolinase N-terminal domain-containing protein n=1 Tax=Pseudonocardia alaniniphila TaxID=75291 RepID=UPI003642DB0A
MPGRAAPPALVGVSLGPARSHAVVIQNRSVITSLSVAGPDPAELFARIASELRLPVAGVVVDIGRLLLERILRQPAELSAVAMIRVVPRAASDPALGRHPDDVLERLITQRFTVPGGHDLFGHELRPLDREALGAVCREIAAHPTRCVAVVAAGAGTQPRHEREVADAVQAAVPDARISAAHEFGGQGLAAREATVVLNAALAVAAQDVLDRCERAAQRAMPGVPLHIARGDGGWNSASRLRVLPVLGLGATDALQLRGAAEVAGGDCRVLLRRTPHPVVGDVRRGLVAVRPQVLRELDTALVVPTATLARSGPDPGAGPAGDVPLVVADGDSDELACIGAAVSRPTAWLDEIAFIESTARLDGVRRDAEARATAIATANGAAPGTADIVEVSTVAVPYSPSGTVRIRVRVAGAPDGAQSPGRSAQLSPVPG